MCCYAHGSATIRFASTDESIINKVLECFEETVYGYKYEYSVCEESIFVSAWGYSEFSTSVISKMLDKLKDIAEIKEGSEYGFKSDYDEYWHFIFENGQWKYQYGKIVYHD